MGETVNLSPSPRKAEGRRRAWRPGVAMWLSAGFHIAAVIALFVRLQWWPSILAAVLLNHVVLALIGLWPKSRLLGANMLRLPDAAANRNEIALTFDDGPDPDVTPKVLDILDSHHAKASFFMAALYFSPTESLTMPVIVAWVYGLPALAPLVFLPSFWARRLRGYRPRWANTVMHSRQLLRAGSLYLMLQMGYVLGWSIDGSLSSAMLGASSAGLLAVVQRLFQLVTVPLGLLNAPLWPAYSDAAARGDRAFLRATLRRSMLFTLIVAGLASSTLVVFRGEIINLWFGKQLLVPTALIVLAAAMATLEATGNSFAMYLNGLHVLKPQLIVAGSFVLISIPVKYNLIQLYGVEGLVASTLLCYTLCVVIPYATFFRHQAFSAVSKEPLHG